MGTNRVQDGKQLSFTCPICHRTSYHPEDVKNHYCGACHVFHDFLPFVSVTDGNTTVSFNEIL